MKHLIISILVNLFLLVTPNKIRIICYHRVNRSNDLFSLSVDRFATQIQLLRKRFRVVSLDQFSEIMSGTLKIKKPLLVTFDDGYADNYLNAYPVMREMSLPFTIFVATGFVDEKRWMWEDIYRHIIMNTTLGEVTVEIDGEDVHLSFADIAGRMEARRIVDERCRSMNRDDRLDFLKRLAGLLGVALPAHPVPEHCSVTWEQLREMARNNVSVGAHTQSHRRMASLNYEEAFEEVRTSKEIIERELGDSVISFAYPKGHSEDYDENSVKAVRASDIRFGFTMNRGLNSANSDPYRLCRIPAPDADGNQFLAEVSGLSDLLAKARGMFKRAAGKS